MTGHLFRHLFTRRRRCPLFREPRASCAGGCIATSLALDNFPCSPCPAVAWRRGHHAQSARSAAQKTS